MYIPNYSNRDPSANTGAPRGVQDSSSKFKNIYKMYKTMVKTNGSHWMCNKSIMYLNELVDDFVFGTNHGLNLIDCKPLSYTYTSN